MSNEVLKSIKPAAPTLPENIEKLLITGDLAALKPEERVEYYRAVCSSLGLNPLTKPFAYIPLNGKLLLYALKDATEQLRSLHGVSIEDLQVQEVNGCYVVRVKARDKHGRTDWATGSVPVKGLAGESLSNAMMKAETKAKRRVTLSLCGLGMLDESEVDSIPGAPLATGVKYSRPLVVVDRKALDMAPKADPLVDAAVQDVANLEPVEFNPPPPKAQNFPPPKGTSRDAFQPYEPPPLLPASTTKYGDYLRAMAAEKARLGEATYYDVLDSLGYAKSNQITDPEEQQQAWKALRAVQDKIQPISLSPFVASLRNVKAELGDPMKPTKEELRERQPGDDDLDDLYRVPEVGQ